MYGVPEDLDLQHLIGSQLARVDLGHWILHFHFDDAAGTTIAVEGEWVLHDVHGAIIDRQSEPSARDCYRLHVLFGRDVTGVSINAPESLTIAFADGYALEIRDDSKQYESFSIAPPGVYI